MVLGGSETPLALPPQQLVSCARDKLIQAFLNSISPKTGKSVGNGSGRAQRPSRFRWAHASAVASPLTTKHAAKRSVFVNLKTPGNLKNCSTRGCRSGAGVGWAGGSRFGFRISGLGCRAQVQGVGLQRPLSQSLPSTKDSFKCQQRLQGQNGS